ncbi:thyroid adenoma-associated protein [Rhincodon typus]|uniref:thyroid adenoma-associated protein n=1 Tax=Rhincodon typus TaxID=259920 RepID=UPI00202FA366|nr:thyroid adenoma-associated protein [Rhincodon typus]
MVLKKKKVLDVGRIVLDQHQLARLRCIVSVEENGLANLLLECTQLTDGIQQLCLLKKIGCLLRKLGGDDVRNSQSATCMEILVRIYWGLESRSPLKRATASALSGIPENLKEEVVSCLISCLKEEMLVVDKSHVRKVIDSIAACMENFSLGEMCTQCLCLDVLQFLHTALMDYKLQNKNLSGQHILQNKLMHDLLAALKTAMVLVQKVQEKIRDILCRNTQPSLRKTMCGLLTCFIEILLDGDFLQTVQNTAGMAALLFIKTVVDHDELLPKLVHDLLFNSIQRGRDVPEWLFQSCEQLYSAPPPDDVVLFLSQGILAMLDWKGGKMREGGERLLLDILIVLLSLNIRLDPFNNRGALGALMTCLRAARAQGLWSTAEESSWDQLIPISLIKQALVHKHEQVRLDALGLLCETRCSTETLSQQEIALIKYFLPYNMNSQSPAMRQQIVWLMKKFFSRLRDSSQVLYKQTQTVKQKNTLCEENTKSQHAEHQLQQYKDFMVWICDTLLQALFPGASFPRKFIVLSLLGIIAEVFENLEGQTYRVMQITDVLRPANVDALLGCLSSTFEELKLLAYDILKKLPPTVLGLQDSEKLQTLLQTALDLSISTKPYDCITASYLLALLVRQESLMSALNACSLKQQTGYHFDYLNKVHGRQPMNNEVLETNVLEVTKYLLICLSDELRQAERSLVHTAASNPLYGRVHCIIGALQQLSLKSVLKIAEWRETVAELILMAFHLSAIVSPICQSSSPEGLIPMDTDLETARNLQKILNEIKPRDTNDYFAHAKLLKSDEDQELSKNASEDCKPSENLSVAMMDQAGQSCQVTAQMVLVCCWRSMKEVSLLLGFLCQNLPLQSTPDLKDGLLMFHQVGEIGEYFKCQLLQSRHRGAFELAYVGFVKLTEMLTSCKNSDLQKLPQQWLEEVLHEVKSSIPTSKLCATRRSAGIPFYIQALVSSEPRGSNMSLLKLTMKELISLAIPSSICQDENATIPQVHSLNILRALFRDTKLGENIIPYVAEGIQAAILGFTSPVWAVRNSSTLLFSALITRIFGVKRGKDEHSKKNRMTGREFFTRFPTLYPFLLKQLEMVANTMDSDSGVLKLHPNLFLLLLVLGRLYPSPLDGTSSALSLAPFVPFIIRCGHSPVHRSREMAARALVPFVAVNQILPMAMSLMETLPAATDLHIRQNHIHGILLQSLHLLRSYFDSKQRMNSSLPQELHDIIACTRAKVWLATQQNPCFLTRATFLDVINIFCHQLDKSKTRDPEILNFWQTAHNVILESELFTDEHKFSPVPGLIQWQRNITKLTLSVLGISVSPQAMSLSPDAVHKLTSGTAEVQSNLLLSHLLRSEFLEVRLLTLETVLLWLEEMDSNQVKETNGNVLFLLSQVEDTLKKLAMQEKHPECLAKVLKILCLLNIEKLFPWIANASVMSEAKLLKWILSITETVKNSETDTIRSFRP